MLTGLINNYLTKLKLKQYGSAGDPKRHELEKVLHSFPEPSDHIERSYFQYLCQCRMESGIKKTARNMAAAVLLPFLLLGRHEARPAAGQRRQRVAFIHYDVDLSIIPKELRARYERIDEYPYIGEMSISADDRRFFRRTVLRRYRNHPFFCLKLLMRMKMYSYVLSQGNYSAIISHCEYSFTSSFLTAYCESRNAKHINVMHGEKTFDLTDAFISFSEFYIWDDWYKDLFLSLRAAPEQFICAIPDSLCFSTAGISKVFDFTYYLQKETTDELERISDAMRTLIAKGYKVAVRPHPRFSVIDAVKRAFSGATIEDTSVSIEMSVLRTHHAISLNSTVLYQAYLNGVAIVIDDITDSGKYQQLFELGYICLDKPHFLLSSIISGDSSEREAQ